MIVFFFLFTRGISSGYADEMRDAKPPVDIPFHFASILAILLALLGGGLLWFFFHWWRHRGSKARNQPLAKDPWQKACEQLEALIHSDLLAKGNMKEYYLRLSGIIRRYFEEQFSIKAPEMTTEEFLIHLKGSADLTAQQKDVLKEFLTSCDIVKFARYAPGTDEVERSTQLARRLIDETKIGCNRLQEVETC